MFKFRSLVLAAICAAPFLLTACGAGDKDVNSDAEFEMAYSENPTFVATFDYSDSDQVALLEDIASRFPETDLGTQLESSFVEGFGDDWTDVETFFDGILEDSFKIGFEMTLPDSLKSLEDIDDLEIDDFDMLFVAQMDKADLFEERLEELFEKEDFGLERVSEGNYVTWTSEVDDFFVARYLDIFFLSNTKEGRDNVVARLDDGEVVFKAADSGVIAEANFAYAHLDLGFVFSLFSEDMDSELEDFLAIYGLDASLMDSFGDVSFIMSADEDGIKVASNTEITSDKKVLEKLIPGIENELSLVEKVSAEGLIFYAEDQDLGFYLEKISNSMGGFEDFATLDYSDENYGDDFSFNAGSALSASLLDVDEEQDPSVRAVAEDVVSGKVFVEMLGYMSDFSGVDEDEIEEMLHAPFAFSMANVNNYLPNIAFYLDISDEMLDTANQFSKGIDSFVDETIVEFNSEIPSDVEGKDAIKREVIELDDEGVLYKVYFDWDAFSDETKSAWAVLPGLDITDFKLEFYYGVIDEDVLLIAFAPDLVDNFGSKSISKDESFAEGIEKMGEGYGYNVSYFATAPLIDLFNTYLGYARLGGFVGEAEMDDIDLYMNQFFGAFKYFIAEKSYEDGVLKSDVYLRIEAVE